MTISPKVSGLGVVQITISAGVIIPECQLDEDAAEEDLLRPKEPVRTFFNIVVARAATPWYDALTRVARLSVKRIAALAWLFFPSGSPWLLRSVARRETPIKIASGSWLSFVSDTGSLPAKSAEDVMSSPSWVRTWTPLCSLIAVFMV